MVGQMDSSLCSLHLLNPTHGRSTEQIYTKSWPGKEAKEVSQPFFNLS